MCLAYQVQGSSFRIQDGRFRVFRDFIPPIMEKEMEKTVARDSETGITLCGRIFVRVAVGYIED